MAGLNKLDNAILYHEAWKNQGIPKTKDGKIKLIPAGAKSIVKALLPQVDLTKKVFQYTTAKYKCVEWLEGLDNWEKGIEDMDKEALIEAMRVHKRLF